MKPNRVVPAAAVATVLTGGAAALTAATVVGETPSTRFTPAVGSVTHVDMTDVPTGNAAVLNWGATHSVGKDGVEGPRWTAYPATFISHMTAGPVAEEAALVRSFVVKLSGLVPTDPAAAPLDQGQASGLLAC